MRYNLSRLIFRGQIAAIIIWHFGLRIAALMRRLGRHWMHWTTAAKTPSHMQHNLKPHEHKCNLCACAAALPFPLRHRNAIWRTPWRGKIKRNIENKTWVTCTGIKIVIIYLGKYSKRLFYLKRLQVFNSSLVTMAMLLDMGIENRTRVSLLFHSVP